jgi:uncharacterized protein DUF5681
VTNPKDSYAVGYCHPPKHTQFPKGRSGNPKGRPKGSQNVSTVFRRVARQRVKVTGKGVSRSMTKLEATVTQLSNQAASGESRAIRDFLFWLRQLEEPVQGDPAHLGPQEVDRSVMESILKRIRQSEGLGSANETEPEVTNPSKEVDE